MRMGYQRHLGYPIGGSIPTMSNEDSVAGPEPRWRVRERDPRRWRRWFTRLLAQADVTAPDGCRYHVRVLRNLPFRDTPLGPFANVVPQHVSLPVLVAANVYARGRTGWSVQILTAQTPWRTARMIFTHTVRDGSEVGDVAIAMVSAIRAGAKPWDEEPPEWTIRSAVKNVMNWD